MLHIHKIVRYGLGLDLSVPVILLVMVLHSGCSNDTHAQDESSRTLGLIREELDGTWSFADGELVPLSGRLRATVYKHPTTAEEALLKRLDELDKRILLISAGRQLVRAQIRLACFGKTESACPRVWRLRQEIDALKMQYLADLSKLDSSGISKKIGGQWALIEWRAQHLASEVILAERLVTKAEQDAKFAASEQKRDAESLLREVELEKRRWEDILAHAQVASISTASEAAAQVDRDLKLARQGLEQLYKELSP